MCAVKTVSVAKGLVVLVDTILLCSNERVQGSIRGRGRRILLDSGFETSVY